MRKFFRYCGLSVVLILGIVGSAGCGRVVTTAPTSVPRPTATLALVLPTIEATPSPLAVSFTPAPTPTPTELPTPTVYTIDSGDSLLSIAQLYNVSVGALQEANGILDPRTLQIGQELVIPQEIEEESAFATATPTPMPAIVQNVAVGENNIGGVWVLGEVLNTTDVSLEQVRVRFMLLGDDGATLIETSNLAALDIVGANETTPFALLIEDAPNAFAQFRTEVASAVPAYVGSYYRELEIRDLQIRGDGTSPYSVSGRVYNFGTVEAINVQVVLTAYDNRGTVVGVRKISPENDTVPKLGETSFSIILAPQGNRVAKVNAVAIGRKLR